MGTGLIIVSRYQISWLFLGKIPVRLSFFGRSGNIGYILNVGEDQIHPKR
jgi:hypothetical protein